MKNKYRSHLFLLKYSKFSNFNLIIKDIKKEIIDNDPNNNLQNYSIKIDNKTYIDDYFILDSASAKKEDIKNLLSNLLSPVIESAGYKFYTIIDIENLNKSCSNSLLKFIENPPKKTIGFLVTGWPNKVMPTIRSRSQEIIINSIDINLDEYIDEKNKITLSILKSSFSSMSEINKFYKSENFKKIIELYRDIKSEKMEQRNIFNHLNNFKKFSKDEINILFRLLLAERKSEKLIKIYELIQDNNININKTLLFDRLISIG